MIGPTGEREPGAWGGGRAVHSLRSVVRLGQAVGAAPLWAGRRVAGLAWPVLCHAALAAALRGRAHTACHRALLFAVLLVSLPAGLAVGRLTATLERLDGRAAPVPPAERRAGCRMLKFLGYNAAYVLVRAVTQWSVADALLSDLLHQPIAFNLFLYCEFCRQLKRRLVALRTYLEAGCLRSSAHRRLARIANARRLHAELVDFIAALGRAYGPVLFTVVVSFVAIILENVFYVVTDSAAADKWLLVEHVVLVFLLVRGVALETEEMVNESRTTMRNAFALPVIHFDRCSKAEVLLFAQQLRSYTETVSCLGLFEADMTLLVVGCVEEDRDQRPSALNFPPFHQTKEFLGRKRFSNSEEVKEAVEKWLSEVERSVKIAGAQAEKSTDATWLVL
ncbi:hypothetical protein AAG570_006799 [Ranatra chinensis]|uniref:Gustatory receptor n=1 Tax=Ranatra chinensis TaxID=642074 RepID=A0ABD0Z7T3_9HEMI